MRLRPAALVLLFAPLAACAPGAPDLDSRISPEARNAPYPELLPLQSLLAEDTSLQPQSASAQGTSLEARAADLRRRAAALRQMPL